MFRHQNNVKHHAKFKQTAIMKNIFALLAIINFTSCVVIQNKKSLISLKSIGSDNKDILLDGYYYQEKTIQKGHYYKNKYGGYSEDSIKYDQFRIAPLLLYSDGSANILYSFSGLQENTRFDFKAECGLLNNNSTESALKHFECYFRYGYEKDNKKDFISKKSQIWNQGVYKVSGSKITLQIFYNVMGDYYLYEERGKIINDSTFLLTNATDFKTKKEYEINHLYKFRKMTDMPSIESYILNNSNKFNKN